MITCTIFFVLSLILTSFSEDYYEILGVPRDASEKQIKRAYKRLSLKYHPDRVKDMSRSEAEKKFEEIANAYEVLSDPQKKRIYDTQGEAAVRQTGGQAANPLEFLQKMLNPQRGEDDSNSKAPKKPGQDTVVILPLDLEDLYMGTQVDAVVSHRKLCPSCNGEGATPSGVGVCPKCQGRGKVVVQQQTPFGIMQMEQPCTKCSGKGTVQGRPCAQCRGFHTVLADDKQVIFVDAGTKDGEEISYDDMGDAYPDMDAEDGKLIFRVREQPHPRFKREGNDLHTTLTITLKEALLGFNTHIKHLDGHNVTIDRTSITTPHGYVEKISGEGMPVKDAMASATFGDLYVEFRVAFPENLSKEQQKLVSEQLFTQNEQKYSHDYGFALNDTKKGLTEALRRLTGGINDDKTEKGNKKLENIVKSTTSTRISEDEL